MGEVVRLTEPCMQLADCDGCILKSHCGLTGMLHQATQAFLMTLDGQTLATAARTSRLPQRVLAAE